MEPDNPYGLLAAAAEHIRSGAVAEVELEWATDVDDDGGVVAHRTVITARHRTRWESMSLAAAERAHPAAGSDVPDYPPDDLRR